MISLKDIVLLVCVSLIKVFSVIKLVDNLSDSLHFNLLSFRYWRIIEKKNQPHFHTDKLCCCVQG